jgi:hypothetical protein
MVNSTKIDVEEFIELHEFQLIIPDFSVIGFVIRSGLSNKNKCDLIRELLRVGFLVQNEDLIYARANHSQIHKILFWHINNP